LYAVWRFDGVAAQAVRALKYRNARGIATVLGDVLTGSCPSRFFASGPLLVAVPMHPTRLRNRGANHATLIADRVATRTLMTHAPSALIRERATTTQAKTQHRAERLDNMRGAFACPDTSVVRDRDIVIIDDVYTTGATLQDCARALKEAGARHVFGLVVARD
jgi:ComF family protein